MLAHRRKSRRQFYRLRPPYVASTAAGVAVPRTPAVLLFHPWDDEFVVAGERYAEIASQTDFRAQLTDLATNQVIQTTTVGAAGTTHTISAAVTLEAAKVYSIRIAYENSAGWSEYSAPFTSRVARSLDFIPLNVPDEPEYGGELPVTPSFPLDVTVSRPMHERTMDTGHIKRRLAHSVARRSSPFVFQNLSASDKDTLLAFIKARVAAGESFSPPAADTERSGREWIIRDGTITVDQSKRSKDVFSVRFEADEVIRDRVFTIGKSKVASVDPIRRGPS